MVDHKYGMAVILLVRSFLVTSAVESVVTMLLVGREREHRTVVKAVALGNAITYAIAIILLVSVAIIGV